MDKQTRLRFNQEDDDEIKKYMKVFGHLPNCNTLVSEKMNKRISPKRIRQRWTNNLDPRLCHDPFDEIEKLYMIEWVKKYKIQNPSADKIPWKKLILEMKDKFGKLRTENKVKNFWHSQERQRRVQRRQLHQNTSQGPSEIKITYHHQNEDINVTYKDFNFLDKF
ncbi:hypothetical protein RhiirA5_500478 [Rhizophagus irregularis]|uniref:HTH myb-type domain-containing protein n=1 Tax=Rhizophagus irregularis TaxID=588596 RepID=A0A2N0PLN2_9GLOM|nr:hypothetical protein RhiirA5_500478 [Rhizophagus irregularis]